MAVGVLLDLDQAEQRDLQALIRALERWFGTWMFSDQNQEQLAGRRRQEEECLGVYAAGVELYARRGYQGFSAAVREDLALQAFLRQQCPPHQARPSVWLWTRQNRLSVLLGLVTTDLMSGVDGGGCTSLMGRLERHPQQGRYVCGGAVEKMKRNVARDAFMLSVLPVPGSALSSPFSRFAPQTDLYSFVADILQHCRNNSLTTLAHALLH
ncbi:unnamed protein product [Boreogadus saida]